MSTKEEQEALRTLVQHVSRAFYEAKYTIILDQLARHPVLKDDELASRMGLQPKELNKLIAVLSNDCLVKVFRQNELKEGAMRAVGRQYYYIDYEHFCNVVKWRIAKMRSTIDNTLRNELDNKGYVCLQCKASYSPLDVDRLMSFELGMFLCDICKGEVVDNENTESVLGSKDRMQRFNHQMRFVRAGLQKSEAMVLPAFDVAAWVKAHQTEAERQKALAQPGGGLKIAGSDPNSKPVDDGVGVVIASDKDEATRKMERDMAAAMKRQQNALPAWHLKSTISGDLTALGIKETARAEVDAAQSSSNEDILKGLGVIGQTGRTDKASTPLGGVTEDVKPTIVHREADYYDQYYANLAAASSSVAPSGLAPPTSSMHSGYGAEADEDEEEDVKPTVQFLGSLNDYRKRSRSQEDEGKNNRAGKSVKMEPGLQDASAFASLSAEQVEEPPQSQSTDNQDDPEVYVNGVPKAFSLVTEEDHDLMTPEEYTAYFEVMQERSEE